MTEGLNSSYPAALFGLRQCDAIFRISSFEVGNKNKEWELKVSFVR